MPLADRRGEAREERRVVLRVAPQVADGEGDVARPSCAASPATRAVTGSGGAWSTRSAAARGRSPPIATSRKNAIA